MRAPTLKQKPRRALVTSFPAPTGGLVSNRNLAMARSPDQPPGAELLENYFPTATGVVTRRGTVRKASITDGSPVRSMFTYISGGLKKLFAANDTGIRDITVVPDADAWVGPDVLTGKTSGDWSVVQFATTGGEFLVGVNGSDAAFLYDGTAFSATTITFPGGSSLTTADLSFAWVYKQRIWFIQKDSLDAWYLDVDQVGGELTKWPMGGVFPRGGVLTWGQAWSLDAGGSGGLSEQCVFTTTEGEVAAYQGLSPDPDQGWTKVGAYRIGRPMGKHGFFRAGGDIVAATTVGLISLSMASKHDYAALGQGAVSYPIEDTWVRSVQERGQADWRCEVWPDGQMVAISPPPVSGRQPVVYVANTNTGKWATFTGWNIQSMAVFDNSLHFGSADGAVRQAWVGGSDEGSPFVARCLPLFDDFDAPASLKIAKMARIVTRSAFPVNCQLSGHADFKANFPPAPSLSTPPAGSEWGTGVWGQSLWNAERGSVITSDWVSIGGAGHDLAVGAQITSNSTPPPDAEIIRIDASYSLAEAGT